MAAGGGHAASARKDRTGNDRSKGVERAGRRRRPATDGCDGVVGCCIPASIAVGDSREHSSGGLWQSTVRPVDPTARPSQPIGEAYRARRPRAYGASSMHSSGCVRVCPSPLPSLPLPLLALLCCCQPFSLRPHSRGQQSSTGRGRSTEREERGGEDQPAARSLVLSSRRASGIRCGLRQLVPRRLRMPAPRSARALAHHSLARDIAWDCI
jgi:hypothetical protein